MKRSQANAAILKMEALAKECAFLLPPYCLLCNEYPPAPEGTG